MAPSSFSSENVLLAWAAQVSLPQLGARLVAYTETKASITTFRLVVQKAQFMAHRGLPVEILAHITSEVRETVFQREEKVWINIHACLTDTCATLSHIPQEDIDEYLSFCTTDQWVNDMEANFADYARAYHQDTKNEWCETLTALDGKSIFAKRVRGPGCHDCSVTAEAYLILLPTMRAPIDTSSGDEVATFAIKGTVDHSLLKGLSKVQLQQFRDAARALDLHRSEDKNEYEPAYMAESEEVISYSEKPDDNNEKVSVVIKPRLMMLGCGELKAGHRVQWKPNGLVSSWKRMGVYGQPQIPGSRSFLLPEILTPLRSSPETSTALESSVLAPTATGVKAITQAVLLSSVCQLNGRVPDDTDLPVDAGNYEPNLDHFDYAQNVTRCSETRTYCPNNDFSSSNSTCCDQNQGVPEINYQNAEIIPTAKADLSCALHARLD
ncbi:MAG: hypothetical protein Q9213_001346 [Squamulea squamosa]